MSTESKLLKLKNEMTGYEKQEMKISGSLETNLKALKKRLGDPDLKDDDVARQAKRRIKALTKKKGLAKDQLEEKMEQITSMLDEAED